MPLDERKEFVLYCWPDFPGRSEYIRLAFEHAGIPYSEKTAEDKIPGQIYLPSKEAGTAPHFIPPALQLHSGEIISQTAAILNHIGPQCGLMGALGSKLNIDTAESRDALLALSEEDLKKAQAERSSVLQLTQTALDWTGEANDVHHPVSILLYYEDQKDEARRAAEVFRKTRVLQWLQHFQDVLVCNTHPPKDMKTFLVGNQTTVADLALFHVMDGMLFAFPLRMKQLRDEGKHANVFALYERVKGEKGIKEYIGSGRRRKFTNGGLFRYYPELDGEVDASSDVSKA